MTAENPVLTCISGDGSQVLVAPLDVAVRELSDYRELLDGGEEIEDNTKPNARATTAGWLEKAEPDLLARFGRPDTTSGLDYEPVRYVHPEDRDAVEAELHRLGYGVVQAPGLAFYYLDGPGFDVATELLAGSSAHEPGEV